MAIQPVQLNNLQNNPSFKKEYKPYLEAEGTITTDDKVKPLPPKGHLVDDDFLSGVKYFFKDIGYDMKSVKNGFNGTANDHQLGRLNDVGLRLGGIGIAAYLASRTTNPKARIMEYVGLATFLTSMAIFPKLAINTPARILHGYDIDKEYIDDQGRKKSVQQDSNYVPYDMYMGGNEGEDLDAIGDRMGIPRDIKNRHDLIREQMRKIATQNNTLWMLTAGFATPLMTALICNGIENYVVLPALEKTRNANANKMIKEALANTEKMDLNPESIRETELSNEISRILSIYENKALPKEDAKTVINLLTDKLDNITADAIEKDVEPLLKGIETKSINKEAAEEMIANAKLKISGRGPVRKTMEELFVPSIEELESLIKNIKPESNLNEGITFTDSELNRLKDLLEDAIKTKLKNANLDSADRSFIEGEIAPFLNNITLNGSKVEVKNVLSTEATQKILEFTKIIGEFKYNKEALEKCQHYKIEMAPETILARYYGKFEKALLSEFKFTSKELKQMRDSEEFTSKIINQKFEELAKDEARYKKFMQKLGKVMSDMESALNGKGDNEAAMKDLITAIENNYYRTALRLKNIGLGSETIFKLIGDIDIANMDKAQLEQVLRGEKNISELFGHSVTSIDSLHDLLDGLVQNNHPKNYNSYEYVRSNAKGVGSSMNLDMQRLLSRYQGVSNSFNRILHTMEVFKRAADPEEFMKMANSKDQAFIRDLYELGKKALLSGDASDFTLKNRISNVANYHDFMNLIWAMEDGTCNTAAKQKGYITDAAKEALGAIKEESAGDAANKAGNIAERFQYYIARFAKLIGNNPNDTKKTEHVVNQAAMDSFTSGAKNNEAMFNLVGQNPVDWFRKAAGRKYSAQKWVKIVGSLTASVFGVAILAQFGFGKIRNKHNIQKQVNDDTNR